MRAALTLIVAAWCGVIASAQEPVVRVTLDEAVARALEQSARLAELQAREAAAAAVTVERKSGKQPSVALSAGYMRTNHVDPFGLVPTPGQGLQVLYPDVPDNYRTRVDLQWPIYTGGRVEALEAAARAEQQASGADLEAARADLRLEVTRAFWALVTARETEQVVTRSLESLDAHVRDLQARLEQGFIPPNDVLTAQAQRARRQLLAIEAGTTRGVAEADLQRLMGIDDARRIEPVATLAPDATSSAAAEASMEEAKRQRAERRAFELRVEAAQERERAAGATSKPQLLVNGGYDVGRPNPKIFPRKDVWNDSWDASMNVTWMLWDGGRRKADVAEAAASTHAVEARANEFDRQLTFELKQRQLEVRSTRAAIAAADVGVQSATEARRVVGERYRAGVVTSTEVLDAEIAVLEAELDRTRAMANARLAEARLARAVGR